ncbi:MAG TPA: LPS assembly lipoprotein LptE [Rhizomicrobium sp.]|nr:LPS assembly lipoprotein LptE [Rhizomicrobium sp.]
MKFRLAGLLAAALVLSGCGFRPLYGTMGANPAGQRIFASIYVEPIEHERMGYNLRNKLMDLLRGASRAQDAAYRLNVTVTETREGVALQNDATITRYDLAFTAKYELTDAKLNVVTKGEETTLESFDVAQSPYASLTGQEEAEHRAAQDLAEHIQIDLGVHFARPTTPR